MIVVKVGGSLFDHPRLGTGLRAWLANQQERQVLLVPGGGDFAEAVRRYDRLHNLGETASHHLAMQTLAVSAHFLRELLPESNIVHEPRRWAKDAPENASVGIVADYASMDGYSRLPESWAVSSDSLALLVARETEATQLILLKSTAWHADSGGWLAAADAGVVDRHFPSLAAGAGLSIDIVDFRSWLDANPPASLSLS